MYIYSSFARTAIVIVSLLLLVSMVAGCCTKGDETVTRRGRLKELKVKSAALNKPEGKKGVAENLPKFRKKKSLSPEELKIKKEKTRNYKRLEYAYSMLMKSNPQGALREIERLQMDIRDDKYLELKTWYLSAMIYHKMGKISRRKRAMRKMLEIMQALQKDPRFKKAFEEGKSTQDIIEMAKQSGGDKYAEFAE
ncbi:MAG: hypothetical protein ACQETH_02885 [Candidatus Rifleibacteriota bacterium]